MKFTKMHGCGNDYIYFDCTDSSKGVIDDEKAAAIALSDRHFGIGGDGIGPKMRSQNRPSRSGL